MSTPSDEGDPRTTVRPPEGRAQPSAFASTVAAPQPPLVMPGMATMPPASAQAQFGDHPDHSLPVGTRLGEFEITQRIGEGGFSIVYLAWDHSLDRKVALKEYMPFSIAARGGHTQVVPRSERHRETFELGLRSFINEAKLLAQFDHPSLVKVYRFWEANGTAYMVMPFYQGQTVRDTVRAMSQPPDEAWIGQLLLPLAQALKVIHDAQCYHRDIAPDNVILLAETGKPLLLDFGAARRVITGMTQQLTVILKPGYAPIEQYDEIPGMKQGPWTDVYALAAVVHWLVTGKTPPPSVGRMLQDAYVPLAQTARAGYSERFLAAVDRALAVMPDRRTASVEQLVLDMGLNESAAAGAGAPAPAHVAAPWVDPDATVIRPRTQGGPSVDGRFMPTLATPLGATPAGALPTEGVSGHPPQPADTTKPLPRHQAATPLAAALPPGAQPFDASAAAPQVAPAVASTVATASASISAPAPAPTPKPAAGAAPRRSAFSAPVLLGGAGAAAVLAAAAWWLSQSPSATVAPMTVPGTSTGAAAVAAPPASPTLSPSPAPAPAAEAVAPPPAAAMAVPAATAAPPPAPPQPVEAPAASPAAKAAAPAVEPQPQPKPSARAAERPARSNAAECASVLQRLSLGESSPELMEKVKTLGCR